MRRNGFLVRGPEIAQSAQGPAAGGTGQISGRTRQAGQLHTASTLQLPTPSWHASMPQQWPVHEPADSGLIPPSQASSPSQVTVHEDAVPQLAPD